LQWTANNSDGCFSFHHDLTINAQPIENRSKKSARRGKVTPPQHESQKTEDRSQSAVCLSADAFHQRQRDRESAKSTKKEQKA